jgi:cell wall-associated NlpC family hydrolase
VSRRLPVGGTDHVLVLPSTPRVGKVGADGESVTGPAYVALALLKEPADRPIAVRDMRSHRIPLQILTLAALTAATLVVLAAPALAKSYSDVPKSHWASSCISSVTDRSADGHRLLDDFGTVFRPERAITRGQLARSIVLASGHYGEKITPIEIGDVPEGARYYSAIQMAVHRGYMSLDKDGDFRPTATVSAYRAETAMIHWLNERYSSSDWSLLGALRSSLWQPNPGWTTGAPSYLPPVVASRQLQLRYNHSTDGDGHEVTPAEPIDRAEIAYMFYRAYKVGGEWMLYGLSDYKSVTFPALSDRQKQVASYALKYIGYPYIWGGEYPTEDSPYGYQKAGGFDCSGYVFYIMKMHFGYGITVNERGAHDMAARAKPRVTRSQLKCGDLIFFGPKGPSSSVESIYHAALYLGKGWFIHSTGSSDGVTLASLNTSSYWKGAFAWGRRLLTPSELVLPSPSPSAVPAAQPAPESTPSPSPDAATPSPAPESSAPAQP